MHFGSGSNDSFLHFFKLEACLGNEGHFFCCIFFLQICNFRAEPLGQAGKIQKTLGYVQKNAKMKKKCKTNENSKNRTKTMFLLVILRYFPGFGIFPSFL
jgi:hypothetical protein